jgi:uncharacterized protein
MNIEIQFFERLKSESAFFDSDFHGIKHWRTVERNGLYLAAHTGADPMVVSYFAYLHDSMRENENEDPKHGPRAANFAKSIRKEINLSDGQFEQLILACSGHTFGRSSKCRTIMTCWDADRLDIGRVGITPDARYLFSDEAKRIAVAGDFSILESM